MYWISSLNASIFFGLHNINELLLVVRSIASTWWVDDVLGIRVSLGALAVAHKEDDDGDDEQGTADADSNNPPGAEASFGWSVGAWAWGQDFIADVRCVEWVRSNSKRGSLLNQKVVILESTVKLLEEHIAENYIVVWISCKLLNVDVAFSAGILKNI